MPMRAAEIPMMSLEAGFTGVQAKLAALAGEGGDRVAVHAREL
jgi:hypothetical protein